MHCIPALYHATCFNEEVLEHRRKQGCGRACQPCRSGWMSCMLPCGSLLSGATGRETWRPLRLGAWEKRSSCLLMKSLATVSSGSRTGGYTDSDVFRTRHSA